MSELDPDVYTVAWFAPLEIEAQAALHMLDNRHRGRFPMGRGDDYVFQAGDMCGHNVIIASLPAGQEYGTGSAAALASQVKKFFPNLWFGLLVGVAAGLPNFSRNPPRDIRLGDVLVGLSEGESAGLIAYDLDKETAEDGFQLLLSGHVLARTEPVVRSAIGSIQLLAPNDVEVVIPHYKSMKHKKHSTGTFVDPGQEHDMLYQVGDDGTERLVERERRPDNMRTRVWYGPIGSGNKLVKNSRKRNELRDKYDLIGLEIEAAGTMNRIPMAVVRGVCDYGDEHKNKEWQPYAAAMAAAYAKAILFQISPKILTDEYRRCLQDLRITDPRDDMRRIEQTKGGLLRDSYVWVLDNAGFRQWRNDQQSRLLWIKGDPGKGKTMLMCGIINELRKSTADASLFAFFFCEATDSRINNATAVLRGLIYLLVTQQPSLIQHIWKKYNHAGGRLFEDANAWVSLSKIFTNMLQDLSLQNTVLAVDALDECAMDLPLLLALIIKTSSAYSRIKWIVSSRNWPSIEAHLDTATQTLRLSLELNEKSVSAAVTTYVQFKVDQLAERNKYNNDTRNVIQRYLSLNANGTFLWVALVCQQLANIPGWKAQKKLTTFPPGLDAIYKRMMDHICNSDDAELCKSILAVVSVVCRPITLEELASFVDIPSGVSDDYESLAEIIGLCGSFLTLRERTISFVHQSAKDFLIEEASQEVFISGIEDEHHTIFSRSLQVMSRTLQRDIYSLGAPGFPIDQVKQPNPDPLAAARYSCLYWVDHLLNCNAGDNTSSDLKDDGLVDNFLRQSYLYWLEALSLLRNMSEGILSMAKLDAALQGKTETSQVIDRVRDSRRFILYHKWAIENSPLQVYALAQVFSPASSVSRGLFNEEPKRIATKPAMKDGWNTCLQTLEGHRSWVGSVAFSHDSTQVASASNDRTIKIWDTATGKCLQTLEGHRDWVSSVAFSHDSTQVASASNDHTVKIWDTAACICLQTLKGHRSAVSSVVFSHDSMQAASASYDHTVKIWEIATGKCLQTLEGHRDWVSSIAFSHDSTQVASASSDRTVKIWDTITGKCLQTLKGHIESVYSAAFSYNSKQVASASGERTVKIWDATAGKCLQTLEGYSESVISVAFSPDGKILASGLTNGTVRLWDADSGAWKQGQGNSFGGQRKVSEVEDPLIAMAISESPPNEQDEQASTTGTFTTLWSDQAGSTKPSSMSYEAAADTEQVIETRSPMTFFNYNKLAIKHKPDQKDDDIQSVKSIPDDIESLVESNSGMGNYRQAAVNYIVKMFTGDPELLALYQEATRMDEAKFVRNHRRLLKTFFLDLRSEGSSPSQTLAVGFLRSRSKRTHISSAIRNLVMPSDSTVREKINIVLEEKKDDLFLLDRLLNEMDSAAQPTPTNTSDEISDSKPGIQLPVSDNADIASEGSENSDDDDDRSSDEPEAEIQEDNALSKLEATAEFLTCGRSFSVYKENLRGFLHPAPEVASLQGSLQLGIAQTSSVAPEQSFSNQGEGERDKISSQIAMLALPNSPLPGKETISPSNSRTWRQGLLRIIVLALLTIIPGGETPLKQGMKRVWWTCFCGRRLYDEFCETIPEGMEEIQEIQRALDTVYAAPNHRFIRQVGRLFGISENFVSGIVHSRWRLVVDGIVPFCVVAVAIAYVGAPIHYPSMSMLISLLLYGSVFSATTAVFFVTGLIIKFSTDQVEFYDDSSVSTPGEQENPEDHRGMRKPSPVHVGVSGSGIQATGGTGTSSSADTGVGPDRAEAGSSAGSQGQSGYSRNDHTNGGQDATLDHPGGANSDPAADGRRHGMEWDRRVNQLWLLALFENTRMEDVYVHVNARVRNTDFTLFKGFRKKYLLVSSGWKRFCRLRQVSALRVVRFHLVDNKRGDVINKDVWPPEHTGSETQLWYYIPYPAKESIPPVGSRYLMSVWRNAHHADAAAYEDFYKKATWHARMLENILHFPHQACQTLRRSIFLFGFSTGALDFDDDPDLAAIADNSLPAEMHPVDAEQPEKQSRSKYIFERLPKRAGSKLEVHFQNDEYPEAWGIQFEERFHVHRALFVLLILYTLFSVALGIWLLKTYGLNLPNSAVSVVGLLTWPLSFMGLTVTVWFKWAENS